MSNKKISLIAAMSLNRVIGYENQLPWHMPADLAHFKKITTNNTVIMGRKTFESIGKPLPHRQNIVITSQPELITTPRKNHEFEITTSINAAIAKAEYPIFIIGGSTLFQQMLPFTQTIYLTVIAADIIGDCFFPELDDSWKIISSEKHDADERNEYAYEFLVLSKHS